MRPAVTASSSLQSVRAGDIAFARMEKVSSELLAITYGSLVTRLVKSRSRDNFGEIEEDLRKIGWNMGARLIDEFLAKSANSGGAGCQSFRDCIEAMSKVGIKMFLGIDSDLQEISPTSFLISFPENPLNDFVELPIDLKQGGFSYSSLYCGLIQGVFEQLHMNVACKYLKDTLRGDDTNSIQVDLVGIVRPDDDDE